MAFAAVDVGALRHPKLLAVSDRAFRVWVGGLLYAQEFLTDGQIPAEAVPILGAGALGLEEPVQELVRAGLWRPDGTGWRIHDWTSWNRTRTQVDALRAQNRDRVTRWRQARRGAT